MTPRQRRGTPWPLLAFLAVLAASPFFRAATPAAEAAPSASTLRDLAYGPDPHQRVDVYLPSNPVHAPTLVYVHVYVQGSGWRRENNACTRTVEACLRDAGVRLDRDDALSDRRSLPPPAPPRTVAGR